MHVLVRVPHQCTLLLDVQARGPVLCRSMLRSSAHAHYSVTKLMPEHSRP